MKTIIYAWRFLVRLKSYTIINLIGLSLSLACCIILLRYINSELSPMPEDDAHTFVAHIGKYVYGLNEFAYDIPFLYSIFSHSY